MALGPVLWIRGFLTHTNVTPLKEEPDDQINIIDFENFRGKKKKKVDIQMNNDEDFQEVEEDPGYD
jgi:hypothetical protein